MKYAIVYSSRTGNTAQLAHALHEALPQDCCEYFGEPSGNDFSASIIFAGFWTDKGYCDEKAKSFLQSLKNKKLFLFGTAGFGESPVYFQKIIDGMKESLDDSVEVIGSFMCQGKMPNAVLQRYEKMLADADNAPRIKEMIDNFHKAAAHPDETDLQNIKHAAAFCFDSGMKC